MEALAEQATAVAVLFRNLNRRSRNPSEAVLFFQDPSLKLAQHRKFLHATGIAETAAKPGHYQASTYTAANNPKAIRSHKQALHIRSTPNSR